MNIEIKGMVIAAEPTKAIGNAGFKKSVVVVETQEEYKQSIPVEFVKDKADKAYEAMQIGDIVTVAADLRGREHAGRYYVSVQGWKWTVDESGAGDRPESLGI